MRTIGLLDCDQVVTDTPIEHARRLRVRVRAHDEELPRLGRVPGRAIPVVLDEVVVDELHAVVLEVMQVERGFL